MTCADIVRLADLLRGRRLAVLTGAGCSTESGIPDYRGPGTRQRARNPIQYRAFVRDGETRRRYWARSLAGWERIRGARPNAGHAALAAMERSGHIGGLITQNVDRLHHAAGSQSVIELHGALAEARCMACGAIEPREDLQRRLLAMNPGFAEARATVLPDGDMALPEHLVRNFRVATCRTCGGDLKPNVVFFGENVPRPVVDAAFGCLGSAQALLVAGSSLMVFSGFRFVRRAAQLGLPVAIVNLGETRGDPLATLRVHRRLGEALPALAEALCAPVTCSA
jgi:NAD+-dependent protein deacetylase sirtuin 4